jgi:hypothetical protein
VTSATFPTSDTSNGYPSCAFTSWAGLLARALGLATAPDLVNAVLVIRALPGSRHTIYDTFDDEKRVI